jgi:hypothetical protein
MITADGCSVVMSTVVAAIRKWGRIEGQKLALFQASGSSCMEISSVGGMPAHSSCLGGRWQPCLWADDQNTGTPYSLVAMAAAPNQSSR